MLETMDASLASTHISDDVTVSASIPSVTLSAAYARLAFDAVAPKIPTVTATAAVLMNCKYLAIDGRYTRVCRVSIFTSTCVAVTCAFGTHQLSVKKQL